MRQRPRSLVKCYGPHENPRKHSGGSCFRAGGTFTATTCPDATSGVARRESCACPPPRRSASTCLRRPRARGHEILPSLPELVPNAGSLLKPDGQRQFAGELRRALGRLAAPPTG